MTITVTGGRLVTVTTVPRPPAARGVTSNRDESVRLRRGRPGPAVTVTVTVTAAEAATGRAEYRNNNCGRRAATGPA